MKQVFGTILLTILTTSSYAQNEDWTNNQRKFYNKLKLLCEYFGDKGYDTNQRGFILEEFVYFENVLDDTSQIRMQSRIKTFDVLFSRMIHFLYSVRLENLDAKPTIFFQDNGSWFSPYEMGGDLNEVLPLTLTYFDKRKPNEPLGSLLFEPKTYKLRSWIIINQGGYLYFLTFNLL